MSERKKTHREVKEPQISARYLADYMAASEQARRTIVRKCKYQAIARVVQHDEAKMVVSKFIREGGADVAWLKREARRLRERLADSDFERDVLDHNADYIERFAKVFPSLSLPDADFLPPGRPPPIFLSDVKVTVELRARLRRITRTNKIRVGATTLRYQKNKPLSAEIGDWQSALLFGYLNEVGVEDGAEPERKLCLTIDAQTGLHFPAPTDSIRRFQNMDAACATIAERWPNIAPPPNAVL